MILTRKRRRQRTREAAKEFRLYFIGNKVPMEKKNTYGQTFISE